jgi:hypothetical protein
MPVYVNEIDQASHVAPLHPPHGRRVPKDKVDIMCAQLHVGEQAQEEILQLLKAASGRLHIKERVIGAAIYFVTDISLARIGVLVGKEELTKGCADLREEMLQHPNWENTVKQLRKVTTTYANLGAIISHFKLSQADNITLRKKINKLDDLVGDKHPKGLVRDVTIMWMAMQVCPRTPQLKDVVYASRLTYQSILRTETVLRSLLKL